MVRTNNSRSRPTQPLLSPLESPTRLSQMGIWRRIHQIVRAVIGYSVAAASLGGAVYIAYDIRFAVHNPTIESTYLDPHDPFRFPYNLTNNSYIFTMYHVRYACLEQAEFANNNKVGPNYIGYAHTQDVLPKKTMLMSGCGGIGGTRFLGRPTKVHVQFYISWTTRLLGIIRCRQTYTTGIFPWMFDSAGTPHPGPEAVPRGNEFDQ
jgi:hypothetical protein